MLILTLVAAGGASEGGPRGSRETPKLSNLAEPPSVMYSNREAMALDFDAKKMDSAAMGQFITTSKELFDASRRLNEALFQQLSVAGEGQREIVGQLKAGKAGAAGVAELQEHYEEAEEATRRLHARTRELASGASNALGKRLGGSGVVEGGRGDPKELWSGALPDSDDPALGKVVGLAEFDLAFSQFYISATLIMLQSFAKTSVDSYEAFLGRPIGAREMRERLTEVGKAFAADLAAIVTKFPFFATALEGVRQWQRDPQREAELEQIKNAEGVAKVIQFKALVERLGGDGADYAEGILAQSVDAVSGSALVPELEIFSLPAAENEAS